MGVRKVANRSDQKIEAVRARRNINQRSDVAATDQSIKNASGDKINQLINSQQSVLQLGHNYRAAGLWAIVGLVIVVLMWLLLRYFG